MSSNHLLPTDTLIDAIREIELNVERIAVVSSEDNRLLGTITDGDIRRHILQGNALQGLVSDVMNSSPITASTDLEDSLLSKLFVDNNIRGIPLIDNNNKFIPRENPGNFNSKITPRENPNTNIQNTRPSRSIVNSTKVSMRTKIKN